MAKNNCVHETSKDLFTEISGWMFPQLKIDSKQFLEDYFNIDLTI